MKINIDKDSPIPIGVQIKEQIRMLINSGEYSHGQKLPSISAFAAALGVNKNTIVAVLKELESGGLIECYRGKGAFVVKKNTGSIISEDFLNKVDIVVREAVRKNLALNEMLNIVSIRYTNARGNKALKALFLMGISQELVELNIKKLREKIRGVDFEGFYINKDTIPGQLEEAFERVDFVIVPGIIYECYRQLVPAHKPIIKTTPELGDLSLLKKGIDKKSKIAVIGANRSGANIMAGMFISERFFRPKIVASERDMEKIKKELKDIDHIVFCISARAIADKIKPKEKNVYFFSDYISGDSINDIKMFIKKTNQSN